MLKIEILQMITQDDIKQLRAILGLTQKELADKIGVSIRTISNYELGGNIPKGKQKMLSEMLITVRNNIAHNTGNVNTGSVGGHNINVSGSDYEKIIDKDKVQIIRESDESKDYQRQIINLESEVKQLRALVASKDEIIEAKNETIEILRKK